MQSSSQLFPVQLVSAEVIGRFVEDIYLLKPNNSADRSVELAVTRLSKNQTQGSSDHSHGQPIILLHGAFSNRRHWLSAEGDGVAAFLVEAGYDVWLPEMRGHGLSSVNHDFAKNTLGTLVEYDLPAIHQFVAEQTGKDVTYIAEEMGGFSILAALALGSVDQASVKSCIYIEEEKPLSMRLNNTIFAKNALWRFKKNGIVSGQQLGLGSENESYPIIKQYYRWQNRQAFNTPAGLELEGAYRQIVIPVLVFGAASQYATSAIKNAKWIYSQLTSALTVFRQHDHSESHTSRKYSDGGITLFPNDNGCWGDILLWLEARNSEEDGDMSGQLSIDSRQGEQSLAVPS